MDVERTPKSEEIKRELRGIWHELHDISEKQRMIGQVIHDLDQQAAALGDTEISDVLRQAFVELNHAGTILVNLHMDVNIPPTVFTPPE